MLLSRDLSVLTCQVGRTPFVETASVSEPSIVVIAEEIWRANRVIGPRDGLRLVMKIGKWKVEL